MNNDTNNEILFWKVFHNIYLFNNIIKSISSTKCDLGDHHICFREKFKDLKSLYEMIKEGKFSLLKCKIENNEDIEIMEHKYDNGINLLFKNKPHSFPFKDEKEKNEFIIKHFKENIYYKTCDEIKLIENQQNLFTNKEMYQLKLMDTLILLLKYKRNQLIEQDILSILFKSFGKDHEIYINLEMIKVVVNEYKLPVTLKSLENAIKYTTPEILDILISSLVGQIPEEIKNNSISISLRKYSKLMVPMCEYILSNQQLYNIPPESSNSIDQIIGGVSRVKISSVFELQSNSIRDKLIKLNYVYDDIGKYKFGDGENERCMTIDNFKEIFKFYVLHDYDYLYNDYLIIYNEPIDGITEYRSHTSSMETLNANGMKHFTQCGYIRRHRKRSAGPCIGDHLKEPFVSTEFLNHYSMEYNNLWDENLDGYIFKYIFSIKSVQEYQDVYNSISNDCGKLKSNLPFKWFDKNKLKFNNNSIIIDSIECADEIANNLNYIISYYNFKNKKKFHHRYFEFENLNVLQYVQVKYPVIFNHHHQNSKEAGILDGNENYQYPFTTAIKNCDIDTLDQFNRLPITGFKQFNIITPLYLTGQPVLLPIQEQSNIIPFNFDQHIGEHSGESKLIELLDYLNLNCFKFFTPELFDQFIKCIGATNIPDLKLKINFNQFAEETKQLFINSIKHTISPRIMTMILYNYNPFSLRSTIGDQKTLFQYWKLSKEFKNVTFNHFGNNVGKILVCDMKFINYYNSTIFIKDYENVIFCTSGDSIQDIKMAIQILFDHLKSDYDDISLTMIETISSMLNELFKRLIRIDKIGLNQVVEIYTFISTKWVSITGSDTEVPFIYKHTLYHIIYYLSIRSCKFIGLFKSLPSVKWVVKHSGKNGFDQQSIGYEYFDYYQPENECTSGGDIFQFLDPSLYTFDFIFNSPIEIIFKQLIQDLVLSHPNLFKEDYQKIIKSTIEYLQRIGEITLSNNIMVN